MKSLTLTALSALLGTFLLTGCHTVPARTQSWEYKKITVNGPLTEAQLDESGTHGWILSGDSEGKSDQGPWTVAILRRLKK